MSFEPETGDRDGKPHKIRIDIRRKDLTLRSRREFSVDPAGARPAEELLGETLRAPLLATDIPSEAHDLHVPGRATPRS